MVFWARKGEGFVLVRAWRRCLVGMVERIGMAVDSFSFDK
jgi:hypothetical protein